MSTGLGLVLVAGFAFITILIILFIVLIRLSRQTQRSIQLIQNDFHNVSKELTCLLDSVNAFVRNDLHVISREASHLIDNLNDLSSDVIDKSHALNFLFKPLHFLNSRLNSNSSSTESTSRGLTISQIVGWIASSIFLIKTTKEFKNDKKSK